MIGEAVTVKGEVGFVDQGPDGIFVGLFGSDKMIGVFIDGSIYQGMTAAEKSRFRKGKILEVTGFVALEFGELTVLYDETPMNQPITETTAPPPPTKDSPPPSAPSIKLSYEISENPESRWQDIVLTVSDGDGNPLPNIPVKYEQTDLDFFFDSTYNPNISWSKVVDGEYRYDQLTEDAELKMNEYVSVGFNTELAYMGIWWNDAEPRDNDWQNFVGLFSDYEGFNYRENPAIPGTRMYRVNLGPDFRYGQERSWAPSWLDYSDEEEFKKQFTEYITAIIDRAKPTIGRYDLYELGLEINDWGNLPWQAEPTWWPIKKDVWIEWVELFKWEADLVKSLDPDARICINLDHMGWDPEIYSVHLAPQLLIEEMIRQGVQFDVIGFEVHPGSYPGEYDTVEFWKRFLDEMKGYGKEIYFWEYMVRSEGRPEDPEVSGITWEAPVDEYTEEYQQRVFMPVFELFFEDPQVIGISMLQYCDPVPDLNPWTGNPTFEGAGLLRADRTPKPAFYELRDYWHAQLTIGTDDTDRKGQIQLKAIPGIFTITVDGQTQSIHIVK